MQSRAIAGHRNCLRCRSMFQARRSPVKRQQGVVLVVDDLPQNLRLLEMILGQQGFQVLTAGDGEEGLAIAARERPDLVLSDVRMPRCDGFDLCRALKATPDTRLTPVVLMTGAAEPN